MLGFNLNIINDYMRKNNLSKAKFAKLCNISPVMLRRFMAHDTSISAVVLFKVVVVVGCSADDLIVPY